MAAILYRCFFVILLNIAFFSTAKAYAFHPFYVSVTEMQHNAKTASLEISCKIFTEDLEDVLKQNYKTSIDLSNDKLQVQNNKWINNYILKHLSIRINSKAAAIKFVGFEKERESVFCYFEILNVPAIQKMTVKNTILQDYKKEQINIMHVIVNGNRKSTKLDFPDSEANFIF